MPEPVKPSPFKFTGPDLTPLGGADGEAKRQSLDRILTRLLRDLEGPRYGAEEQEIGKGGQARVLCVEERRLKREIAKKVLPVGPGAHIDPERFVREARITAQLEHPNIVPVYELGVDSQDKPRLYYTMKRVKGRTLQEVIKAVRNRKGAADLRALLTIFEKACDAVAFANARGVIHRDLKPENIMVGEFGEVLVMDWGIAKVLGQGVVLGAEASEGEEAANADHFLQTMTGSLLGTPEYMSPEQARGNGEEVDERSDVYALGAVLHELLTVLPAKELSEEEERRFQDLAEAEWKHLPENQRRPPTLSEDDWKGLSEDDQKARCLKYLQDKGKSELLLEKTLGGQVALRMRREKGRMTAAHCPGGRVPEAIVAVVLRALSLKKEERYPTVLALQQEVQAFQGGLATLAENAGALRKALYFVKRHKAVSTSVASALLLIATLWGFFTRQVMQESDAKDAALGQLASANRRLTDQTQLAEANERKAQQNADEAKEERDRAESELASSWALRVEASELARNRRLADMRTQTKTRTPGTFAWWAEPAASGQGGPLVASAVKAQVLHANHAVLLARLQHESPIRHLLPLGTAPDRLAVTFSHSTFVGDSPCGLALWRCSDWRLEYQTPVSFGMDSTGVKFVPPMTVKFKTEHRGTPYISAFRLPEPGENPFLNVPLDDRRLWDQAFCEESLVYLSKTQVVAVEAVCSDGDLVLPTVLKHHDVGPDESGGSIRNAGGTFVRVFEIPTPEQEMRSWTNKAWSENGRLIVPRSGGELFSIDYDGHAQKVAGGTLRNCPRRDDYDSASEDSGVEGLRLNVSKHDAFDPNVTIHVHRYSIGKKDTEGEKEMFTTIVAQKSAGLDEHFASSLALNESDQLVRIPARVVDVRPDGLALILEDEFVRLVRLDQPETDWLTIPHKMRLLSGCFLSDGRLAVGDSAGVVHVWQLSEKTPLPPPAFLAPRQRPQENTLSYLPQHDLILREVDLRYQLQRLSTGKLLLHPNRYREGQAALLSPDGSVFVHYFIPGQGSSTGRGRLRFYSTREERWLPGERVLQSSVYGDESFGMNFSADGKVFAAAGGNQIWIWERGIRGEPTEVDCYGVSQIELNRAGSVIAAGALPVDGALTFLRHEGAGWVGVSTRLPRTPSKARPRGQSEETDEPLEAKQNISWTAASFDASGDVFACVVGGILHAIGTRDGAMLMPPRSLELPHGYVATEATFKPDGALRLRCQMKLADSRAEKDLQIDIPLLIGGDEAKRVPEILTVAKALAGAMDANGRNASHLPSALPGWLEPVASILRQRNRSGLSDSVYWSSLERLDFTKTVLESKNSRDLLVNPPKDPVLTQHHKLFLAMLDSPDRGEKGGFYPGHLARKALFYAALGDAQNARTTLRKMVELPGSSEDKQNLLGRALFAMAEAGVLHRSGTSDERRSRELTMRRLIRQLTEAMEGDSTTEEDQKIEYQVEARQTCKLLPADMAERLRKEAPQLFFEDEPEEP